MSVISDETNDYIKENLKKLKNPDAGASRDYSDPKQVEELEFGILDKEERHTERMLGAILKNKPLLEKLRHFVKPVHFKQHAHRRLIQMAFDYFDKYQTAPPLDSIAAKINAEESDQAKRVYLTSVAESCYEAFEPAAQNPQEFLDFAADICAKNEGRLAAGSLIDALQKNKPYEALAVEVAERSKKIRELAKPPKQYRYSFDELLKLPPAEWLIDRHFGKRSLSMLFGESNCGKSFVALDMAFCVATGKRYLDKYEVRQGPVFYVASEGAPGYKARAMAWQREHDRKPLPNMFELIDKRYPMPEAGAANEIIKDATAGVGKPALVVIDTVNRNFGAGVENDAADMTKFISSADTIAEHFDCCVLLVHHTGKDAAKGARGHSSLHAACDSIFKISGGPKEGNVNIDCKKQKDADGNLLYDLRAKTHLVGDTPYGSLVLLPYGAQDQAYRYLKDGERHLGQLLAEGFGVKPFKYGEAIKYLEDKKVGETAFNRNIKPLLTQKLMIHEDKQYRIPEHAIDLLLVGQ